MVWSTYLCACECGYMCLSKPLQKQHKTVCVKKPKTIQNMIFVYYSVYNHAGSHILRVTHAVDMVWSTHLRACEFECMYLYKPLQHTTKNSACQKPQNNSKINFIYNMVYNHAGNCILWLSHAADTVWSTYSCAYDLEYVCLHKTLKKWHKSVPKPTKQLQKECPNTIW